MIKKIVFLFVVLAVLVSCEDNIENNELKDDSGVVIFKDELWQTPTAPDGKINFTAGVFTPVYDDMFIGSIHLGDQTEIAAFDINTGAIRWRWRDFIGNDVNLVLIHIIWPYTYENRLIFHLGNSGYCIDMNTGQTIWKQEDNIANTHSYINGYGNKILKTISPVEYNGEKYGLDYVFDVNGNEIEFIAPQPLEALDTSALEEILVTNGSAIFEHLGKEYLVNVSGQADEKWIAYPYLGLFNRTSGDWEYHGIQLTPAAFSQVGDGFPVVEDGIVVNSINKHICANDLWTGDSLWAVKHSGNFVFGGFFVHEGHVYALSEADALYCYDLYTGDECWRMDHDGLGTASRMVHMNDVIYFRSGGNGRLMAVDMENGDLLWNLKSPDQESFMPDVAVYKSENGEKGKVLAATYQSALCYEAIK